MWQVLALVSVYSEHAWKHSEYVLNVMTFRVEGHWEPASANGLRPPTNTQPLQVIWRGELQHRSGRRVRAEGEGEGAGTGTGTGTTATVGEGDGGGEGGGEAGAGTGTGTVTTATAGEGGGEGEGGGGGRG